MSLSTRRACIEYGMQRLQGAGRDAPRRTAIWLLCDLCQCSQTALYAHPDAPVGPEVAESFKERVQRRVDGEPLQHILGYSEFYGLRIDISPKVLVPRPETEELVEHVLRRMRGDVRPRILDVGTGSGCIALAVKHERPDARVVGCDVSEDALAVARENAERLDLDVSFQAADLLAEDFPDVVSGPFDWVVSNPPYIPDDEADALPDVVREHDPPLALFAGDDPLRFYRALARHAPDVLVAGGRLVVETHAQYATDTAEVFAHAGFTGVHIEQDLSGRPRIAMCVWGVRDEG